MDVLVAFFQLGVKRSGNVPVASSYMTLALSYETTYV